MQFHRKIPPSASLRSDGKDPAIPPDLKDHCDVKNTQSKSLSELEDAVVMTPPDPQWPSGLLSIQIHEIRDMGYKSNIGTDRSSQNFAPGQEINDLEQEEEAGLPSTYCIV